MVMRVTGRGSNGRAHLVGGPHAHMNPTKLTLENLDIRWSCSNTGGSPSSAFLDITEGAITVLGPASPTVTIGPGLTAGLILFQRTVDLSIGVHTLQVNMREALPVGGTRLIASHPFTLTVQARPAFLVAVGDPTIS